MRYWQRWWPLTGVLFVVLFLLAVVLVGDTGQSAEEGVERFAEARDRLGWAYLAGAVSTLFLLAFFASVRDGLLVFAPRRSVLASLTLAPVAGAAALLIGSLSLLFGLSESASDGGTTAEVVGFGNDAQYAFLVGAMMLTGLAVGCASLGLRGTGVLPGWLCIAGLVAAALQLIAFMFIPMMLLVLWILVAAVMLAVRPPDRAALVVDAEHARPGTPGPVVR